jgi:protein phosphatase
MGGHDAGDYASQTIPGELASVGFSISSTDIQARFMERLGRAHHQIRAHAESLGGGTVGATLVGLMIFEAEYSVIWSGDSRIYRMRDGVLEQLTKDHTEVQELLDAGRITPEEGLTWPRKNVITRAIGVSEDPNCDMATGNVRAGDVFLLCSDGLTEHNSDEDLQRILHGATSPQEACDQFIAQTLERGAKDNTTAVVVKVSPSDVDIWT